MSKISLILSFVTLCVISNLDHLNAQADKSSKTYVVEEVSYTFYDELDYAFYQSYNAFLEGHDAISGARLKRAAYFVKQEAEMAKANNKKPIENQAKRLEVLADSVALGKITSPARLRRAFVRTHHVLAHNYKLRATSLWAAEKTKKAGHAMVSAAGHLGHAAKWSGKQIGKGAMAVGKGTKNAGKAIGKGAVKTGKAIGTGAETVGVESVRGVKWLGSKMIQGIAFVPENVGKALKWLGGGIDKVGEDVAPKARTKQK